MVLLPGCNCCPLIYGISFRGFRNELHEWNYDSILPFGRTGVSPLPNFPRPTPTQQMNGRFLWANVQTASVFDRSYDRFYAPPPPWYGLVSAAGFGTFCRFGLGRVRKGTKVETEYTSTKCRCYLTLETFTNVTQIVYERDLDYMPDVRASGIFRFDGDHVVEFSNVPSADPRLIQRYASLCTTPIISPPAFQESDIGEVTLFRDSLLTPGFLEEGQTMSVQSTLGQYAIPASQNPNVLLENCNAVNLDFSFSQTPKAIVVGGGAFDTATFTEGDGSTSLYWRRTGYSGLDNPDQKEFSAMFVFTAPSIAGPYYASINVNEILWKLYSDNGVATFDLSPTAYSPLPGIHGPADSTLCLRLFDSFSGDFSYTVTIA